MSVEVKWHDECPETGGRRYLAAEYFARKWHFRYKLERRGDWTRGLTPTRAMWEHVLDSIQRRYQRRRDVSPEQVAEVETILKHWVEPGEPYRPASAGQ